MVGNQKREDLSKYKYLTGLQLLIFSIDCIKNIPRLYNLSYFITCTMEYRRRSSVAAVSHGNDGVMRVNDDVVRRLSVARPDIFEQQQAAGIANNAEKGLTVRQSIKLYKKGIFFSLMMSLAVVMEGSVQPPDKKRID